MATSHSHVTITILPCSLSLVHIPRPRIAELSRPILKQILRKQPTFLNLTANEIELSIFAEDESVGDFEPIARRDRQRQRVRAEARAGSVHGHRTKRAVNTQPVEISFEKWKVLQIDAHEDSLSTSPFNFVLVWTRQWYYLLASMCALLGSPQWRVLGNTITGVRRNHLYSMLIGFAIDR